MNQLFSDKKYARHFYIPNSTNLSLVCKFNFCLSTYNPDGPFSVKTYSRLFYIPNSINFVTNVPILSVGNLLCVISDYKGNFPYTHWHI